MVLPSLIMSKLLRYYKPGQIYFVTCVTHNREPILADQANSLLDIIDEYKRKMRFEIIAHVIMPDHFHIIIDPKRNNLSDILKRIKISFAYRIRKTQRIYSQTIWQKRFWDHIIRDENDFNAHIEYIHYNPVKHGFVKNPLIWEHSSFGEFINDGLYEKDWGKSEPEILKDNNVDYGE